jgi:alkylation response protein AidB-like acyl-CoA dehydrogenase
MMLGPTLMAFGTDEQQRELIPRLLSGEDAWCQLFSEPGAGSDLASLACRAVRDGDDFVVTGQKVWNSAAQWCDHGMLLARTNPDAPKHHGITFLLVDMHTPGIEVRPLIQATGAAHFNEVFFEDVRVPVSAVLGEIDGGWAAARTVMSNESAMIGGSGSNTFATLLLLAQEFSRRDDPLVRQRLADYYAREKALGLLADRIMNAVRRRERPPVDPSILKLFIAVNRAISGDLAVAIAGPAGLLEDDEVGRWVEAELLARYGISIGGGTNEVQRNNLAERALGLPKEPSTDRGVAWSETLRS